MATKLQNNLDKYYHPSSTEWLWKIDWVWPWMANFRKSRNKPDGDWRMWVEKGYSGLRKLLLWKLEFEAVWPLWGTEALPASLQYRNGQRYGPLFPNVTWVYPWSLSWNTLLFGELFSLLWLHSTWHLSSPTRDWTCTPYTGSMES